MAFADLLRTYRERAGVTKTELARNLGVTFTAVHAWESGKLPPPLARTKQIADLLAVPKSEVELFCYANAVERAKPETAALIRDLQRQVGDLRHELGQSILENDLPVYRAIPLPPDADTKRATVAAPRVGEDPGPYGPSGSDRYVLEVTSPVSALTPERHLFPGDQVVVEVDDATDPASYDQRICVILLDGRPSLRQVRVQCSEKITVVMLHAGEGETETFILGQRSFKIIGVVVRLINRKF